MISKISPNTGATGGGTVVTISGTNFAAGATVSFDGVAATDVTVESDLRLTATIPAGRSGAVKVTVLDPNGQSGSLENGFTYEGRASIMSDATISSVRPPVGTTAGGTNVLITGTNFQIGATVTFGGTAATAVMFMSATSLIATTPAHAAGAVAIVVTNPDGQSGTLTSGFGYSGTLSITAAPASFSYPATVLTGNVINLTSSFTVSVNDATLSSAGWNLQAQIGTLKNAANDTIAASNQTITAAVASGTTGTPPTNSIGYPIQIPTTTGKIYNAAVNTGNGQATVTFSTKLAVPANTPAGTYSTTLTITIVSGP